MEQESRINHDGAVYEDEYQYGKKQSHDVFKWVDGAKYDENGKRTGKKGAH